MRTNRTLTLGRVLATTLTAAVAAAAVMVAQTPAPAASAPPVAQPTSTAVPTTSTAPPATTTSTTAVLEPAPDRPATLRPGDRGPGVRALQQRLRALGFWLGQDDGTYGALTVQAVLAAQKVHGLRRDGVAGAAVFAALASDARPAPKAGGADRVEIDKRRQVLYVVRGDAVQWVLNVSTGTETRYRANGRTMLADTPSGRWVVRRVHDGWKQGELGAIYRPRYFHSDGIAVHGHRDVPAHAASHGCVRVSFAAMDWIWSAGVMPAGSEVWVY